LNRENQDSIKAFNGIGANLIINPRKIKETPKTGFYGFYFPQIAQMNADKLAILIFLICAICGKCIEKYEF
jgi:hypothetical protein